MILSIDVGECNFAYCIGDLTSISVLKKCNVKKTKTQNVLKSCLAISEILSQEPLIPQCTHIIIEQQYKCNTRALKIGQHLWTWCSVKFPSLIVTFTPSTLKTRYFLGKNTMNYHARKVWSINKTVELLKDQPLSLNLLKQIEGKKDDVSDAYLQLYTYIKHHSLSF